jgi:hypothetical protein
VTIESHFFSDISERDLPIIIGFAFVFFVIPFLFVHATAWVIRGFREDKKNNRNAL